MRLGDFEQLVGRLATEVPSDFLEGVAGIAVSPKALPHPTRAEIYTLGECIPLPATAGMDQVQSQVVLYHGSFQTLADLDPEFDWRQEAWDTLIHELRHHLEWRARVPDLERFDAAADQNFAREAGEPFDLTFYLDGEAVGKGIYRIEDDFFLDRVLTAVPPILQFEWHGVQYGVTPPDQSLPQYLTVKGLVHPPPGSLILVLRRSTRLRDLLQREVPSPVQAEVEARRVS